MILTNKSKVLIFTHYAFRSEESEDVDQRIVTYLKKHVGKIVQITHPFPEFDNKYSYLQIFEGQKRISEFKISVIRSASFIRYLHHIIIILFLISIFAFGLMCLTNIINLSIVGL